MSDIQTDRSTARQKDIYNHRNSIATKNSTNLSGWGGGCKVLVQLFGYCHPNSHALCVKLEIILGGGIPHICRELQIYGKKYRSDRIPAWARNRPPSSIFCFSGFFNKIKI